MIERTVEDHLCRRVKQLGGEVRKVRWLGRRGAPDRLVLLPDRKPTLIELKRPAGKARPHQLREHRKLRLFRFSVIVLDTIEMIDTWLETCDAPPV